MLYQLSYCGFCAAKVMKISVEDTMQHYKKIPEIDEVVIQDDVMYEGILRKIKPEYVVHGDNWRNGALSAIREPTSEVLMTEMRDFSSFGSRSTPGTSLRNTSLRAFKALAISQAAVSATILGKNHSARILSALRAAGVPEEYLFDPNHNVQTTETITQKD